MSRALRVVSHVRIKHVDTWTKGTALVDHVCYDGGKSTLPGSPFCLCFHFQPLCYSTKSSPRSLTCSKCKKQTSSNPFGNFKLPPRQRRNESCSANSGRFGSHFPQASGRRANVGTFRTSGSHLGADPSTPRDGRGAPGRRCSRHSIHRQSSHRCQAKCTVKCLLQRVVSGKKKKLLFSAVHPIQILPQNFAAWVFVHNGDHSDEISPEPQLLCVLFAPVRSKRDSIRLQQKNRAQLLMNRPKFVSIFECKALSRSVFLECVIRPFILPHCHNYPQNEPGLLSIRTSPESSGHTCVSAALDPTD